MKRLWIAALALSVCPTFGVFANPVVSLGDADVKILGAAPGNRAYAANGAGDVNNDGYADVVLGAALAGAPDADGYDPGEAYIIFGGPEWPSEIDLSNLGSRGIVITPGSNGGRLGYDCAGVGDVNEDGIDDFVVSALRVGDSAGIAYIIYGSESLPNPLDVSALGAGGVTVNGTQANAILGRSVSSAGDFNNDGIPDVALGAPRGRTVAPVGGSVGRTNWPTGMVYVIYGGAGLPQSISINSLGSHGTYINGVNKFDFFGGRVANAGDFNGDGISDLVIGASKGARPDRSGVGTAYVVYGEANPPAVIDIILDTSKRMVIYGERFSGRFGHYVAGNFDFNNDGRADILVSANNKTLGLFASAGEARVIYGRDNPPSTFDIKNYQPSDGVLIQGIGTQDYFGSSVSCAGDLNRDKVEDIFIGAIGADPNGLYQSGQSYVLYGGTGKSSFDLTTLGDDGTLVNGEFPGDESGYKVANVGDVNGDMVPDLLVCAWKASPEGREEAGTYYIVFGPPTPTPEDLACTLAGDKIEKTLTWKNPLTYSSIRIERNGDVLATLPGDATSYVDRDVIAGDVEYKIFGVLAGADSVPAVCIIPVGVLSPINFQCIVEDGDVALTWVHRHPTPLDGTRIYRDGDLIATLTGNDRSYRDVAPPPGPHTYEIEAFVGGESSRRVECAVNIPVDVADLACSADGCDVTISWVNRDAYDSVIVTRDDEVVATLTVGAMESFVDRGATPGEYSYQVRGCIGDDCSKPATCSVTVLDAVQNLDGSSLAGDVSLTWDAPSIGDAILLSRGGALIETLAADASSYSDPGLDPGSYEYELRVQLGDHLGKPATVTVEVVGAPTAFDGCGEGREISLTWTNTDTYDSIEFSVDGGDAETLAGTTESYIYTHDQDGAVSFSLVAVRGNGRSATVIAAEVIPTAPTIVSASYSGGVLSIEWTISGSFDAVEITLNDQVQALLPGDTTSVDYTLPKDAYRIEVRGLLNDEPDSCPNRSDAATETVDAPFDMMCSADGADVTLEWMRAIVYDAIRVERNGKEIAVLDGDADGYEDTVPGGGTYEYRVYGVRGGSDTQPASCTIRVLSAPEITCETDGASVTISWTTGEDHDQVVILRNGNQIAVVPAAQTSYTDNAPEVGTNQYQVRLQSGDDLGIAAECERIILAPPSDFRCSSIGGTVTLGWENEGNYDRIEVFRDGVSVGQAGPGDTSFTDEGVTPGEHCYTLQAFTDDGGVSAMTEECCIEIPLPPIRLACSAEDAVLKLSWDNPRGYDMIEILRDGSVIETIDGSATMYSDPEPLDPGTYTYGVRGRVGTSVSDTVMCEVTIPQPVANLDCHQDGTAILLSWTVEGDVDEIIIVRNGEEIATLPGDTTEYTDDGLEVDVYSYEIRTAVGDFGGVPVQCAVDMINGVTDLLCMQVDETVFLTWTLGDSYDEIVIYRNDVQVGDPIAGDATSFEDPGLPTQNYMYRVVGVKDGNRAEAGEVACLAGPENVMCVADRRNAIITWEFAGDFDSFRILRRSADEDELMLIATLTEADLGDGLRYVDGPLEPGEYYYAVESELGGNTARSFECGPVVPASGFIRGEINGDARIDIADAIYLLGYLFRDGPAPTCDDASDTNDDGLLNVSDVAYFVLWRFAGGEPPPPPTVSCDEDPTDDALECDTFPQDLCP
ncbi:MAG: hypothetical protein AAF517_00715 [Planctomycetota bacterium]